MILDRGLADLMQSKKNTSDMRYVNTDSIKPGLWQVRESFNDQSELEESIKKYGILEPILLKAADKETFFIIGGERRWRAAKSLNIQQVPARILHVSDDDALLLGVIENVQRSSLSPIEEAKGYKLMLDRNMTQENIAHQIGKSRSYIANALRLLKLPDKVQLMIQDKSLNISKARTLIGQDNSEAHAREIISQKKTVKIIEEEKLSKDSGQSDLNLIASQLSETMDMNVKIISKGKGGVIQIEYKNLEKLDDFLSRVS